jgi:hypothetical protein
MKSKTKSLSKIQQEGIKALINTLGPVDTVRFIQIYDPGYGDYTSERKTLLPDDLEEYFKSIEKEEKKRKVTLPDSI